MYITQTGQITASEAREKKTSLRETRAAYYAAYTIQVKQFCFSPAAYNTHSHTDILYLSNITQKNEEVLHSKTIISLHYLFARLGKLENT